jgi:hypothetical protein
MAAPGQELVVASVLDDPAVFHHEDAIGVSDRRESVRDDDARSSREQAVDGALYQASVSVSTELVASSRIMMRGSATSARARLMSCFCPWRAARSFANHRVESPLKPRDEAARVRVRRGLLDLRVGRVEPAVAMLSRIVPEKGAASGGVAELAVEPVLRALPVVDAVDPDLARLGLVEPAQEIDERRLAASRLADDRHGLSAGILSENPSNISLSLPYRKATFASSRSPRIVPASTAFVSSTISGSVSTSPMSRSALACAAWNSERTGQPRAPGRRASSRS